MADLTQELLDMKTRIDNAKAEANRIEGQISQLERQRTEEFGCATDDEANVYIEELKEQIARLESEIQSGVKIVKEELGW